MPSRAHLLWLVVLVLLALSTAQGQASSFAYQGTVTVSAAQVEGADQTNFPVLFSGTYPALATLGNGGSVTNPNGYDIVFTSDSAGLNPLHFERESYSPNGQVVFWVQVPTLSHTSNTVFYIFSGNAAITSDQSTPGNVWSSNYLGVWHLPNGTILSANDSTSNAHNGTISGAVTSAGEIGGAASFSSGSQIDTGSWSNSITNAITVSAWVKPSSTGRQDYVSRWLTSGANQYKYNLLQGVTSGKFEFYASTNGVASGSGNGPANVSPGIWAYVVGVYDGAHISTYVNGVLDSQSSLTGNLASSSADDLIGKSGDATSSGVIDEVRISNVARSAGSIATEYNNQSNPSAFYTVTFTQLTVPTNPALSVSPSSTMSFVAVSGGGNPAPQSLNILSSNSLGVGAWTAQSSQPWITFSTTSTGTGSQPLVGSGASTIYVQIASGSLSQGISTGSVTISATGAIPSSQMINVSVNVTSSTQAQNGYGASAVITISHTQVPNTDQTNFPLLFSGTFPALATTPNGGSVTNQNGYDIIFTSDAAGVNPLNFDRETYISNGQVVFWVQIPALSHTTDTTIYLWYGNSTITTDQANPGAVWGNYKGVWHLGSGLVFNTRDSSANANTGTLRGAVTATPGQIGTGGAFAGGSMAVGTTPFTFGTGDFTVSLWAKTTLGGTQVAFGKTGGTDYWLGQANGVSNFSISGLGVTSGAINDGNWHYLVGVRSSGLLRLFVDGIQQGGVSNPNTASPTGTLVIGNFGDIGDYAWGGGLDEARISAVGLTPDWISAEFNNQSNPSAFYSVTLTQTAGGPTAPALSVLPSTALSYSTTLGSGNPTAQSLTVSSSNSLALGNWTAQSSQSWIILASTASGTGSQSFSSSGPGTFYVQVSASGLPSGTSAATVTITSVGASPSSQTINVSVNVAPCAANCGNLASVTYVNSYTPLPGNWQGVYGADGWSIPSVLDQIPSYVTLTELGSQLHTWAANTTDTRALTSPLPAGGRNATCWFNQPSFTFDVNITDNNSHNVTFYAVDWDSNPGIRSERFDLTDATTGALLDTETLQTFQTGTYLTWQISGHVRVTVTITGGMYAVVSGIFFN